MPEHPTRPDRPGPLARRRAALAAAALAVAGLVLLSFALVARDSSGQVPGSAVVPPGGPATVPVPTIGTSVSTRRTTRAGVDQPRADRPWQRVPARRAEHGQRQHRPGSSSGPSTGPSGASASGWPTASTRASSSCAARARPASGSRSAGRATRCCGATPSRRATCSTWTGPLTGRSTGSASPTARRASWPTGPPATSSRASTSTTSGTRASTCAPSAPTTSSRATWSTTPACARPSTARASTSAAPTATGASTAAASPTAATATGSSATRSAPTSPPRGSISRRGPAAGWSAATIHRRGMTGADSWVDVKGNGWRSRATTGA